jgi:diacylglycerol kinase family enzyme
MAASMAVVVNPRSGSAPDAVKLDRALRAVSLSAEIRRVPTRRVDDWVADLARRHDVLVAAGGDGTVSTVAAAAVQAGRTFGVLPAGTLNHFARDVGIPRDLEDAVTVLAAGHTRLFDVGTVNGLVFINNASLGAYPRLVWERARVRRKGLPRLAALTLAVLRTWIHLPNVTVRLSVDGAELIRRSPLVVVGNGEYLVHGTAFGRRATIADGRLWLYVAPHAGRLDMLALPARALLGTLQEHDGFETFQASSISMELPRRRIRVALDGEIRGLVPPLRFELKRHALRVVVPPARDGDA